MTERAKTIGILYPGEMGSNMGKLLLAAGLNVITTNVGKSARTQDLCADAGMVAMSSLRGVIAKADIVISIVPPSAAISVAEQVAAVADCRQEQLLYVDANSISPLTVFQISDILNRARIDFLDLAILGPAAQLQQRGTIYLSGARASEMNSLFAKIVRTKVVGQEVGQASALKMIISGIPKGLSALFMEAMLFAQEMDLLDEALESCQETYPSIMELIVRMLPTYTQHAARRCEELLEVEKTMRWKGMTPCMMQAVREVTEGLAAVDWTSGGPRSWTLPEIIEAVHKDSANRGLMI